MKMFLEVKSPDRADAWVKERLGKKRKIMGFGHRVYSTAIPDPEGSRTSWRAKSGSD